METLISDLKKVMNSDIDNKDKYIKMLINGFLRERDSELLTIQGVVKSLKESKPKTFELWMKSKGYKQNSKKQWLKHVYTMDARTLNNFKLEYESL